MADYNCRPIWHSPSAVRLRRLWYWLRRVRSRAWVLCGLWSMVRNEALQSSTWRELTVMRAHAPRFLLRHDKKLYAERTHTCTRSISLAVALTVNALRNLRPRPVTAVRKARDRLHHKEWFIWRCSPSLAFLAEVSGP